MAEWVRREGWTKFRSPEETEWRLDHEIRVEARATEDAALADGLTRSLPATTSSGSGLEMGCEANPGGRAEFLTRCAIAGVKPVNESPEHLPSEFHEGQTSPDRPARPISTNTREASERPRSKPDKSEKWRKSAEVLPFPGSED
jgi:hypothetical protein